MPDAPVTFDRLLTAAELADRDVRRLLSRDTVLSPEDLDALPAVRPLTERLRALLDEVAQSATAAREDGRLQGRHEGLAEAEAALALARAEYDALLHRAEADLVSLALELARRIVGRHLEVEPEGMADLVRQTLTLANPRRRLELRVHPRHAAHLQTALAAQLDALGEVAVSIVGDVEVPEDGCRIETEAGVIETDLETQMAILSRSLGVALWAQRGRREAP